MGAKTWMLVYSGEAPIDVLGADPTLDRAASAALAHKLFPTERLEPLADGDLSSTCPPGDEVMVGCFPQASVVAAREFITDHPSRLHERFLDPALGSMVHLHAMHSVTDWLGFAVWHHGKLERALSVSPGSGVIEDIGERLPFEIPFWEGRHPVGPETGEGAYPLAFHPLELGDEALLAFFDYQLEGAVAPAAVEPGRTPLMRFRRSPIAEAARERPWWKVW